MVSPLTTRRNCTTLLCKLITCEIQNYYKKSYCLDITLKFFFYKDILLKHNFLTQPQKVCQLVFL